LHLVRASSFKSQMLREGSVLEWKWNTILDSVMTMKKLSMNSSIKLDLWEKTAMIRNGATDLWKGCFNKTFLAHAARRATNWRKTLAVQNKWIKPGFPVGYWMIQCDSFPVPQTRHFIWRLSVKSSPEKFRWIIVALKTDKSRDQTQNPEIFNHCNFICVCYVKWSKVFRNWLWKWFHTTQ